MMEGFKKRQSKHFRRRKTSTDSENESDNDIVDSAIEGLKEVQRLRKRHHGVCAEDLNAVKVQEKQTQVKADPLKLETGGYVDYKTIKKGMTDELEEQIGTAFASETNRRDEDTEMLKYVDEEMAKRKGQLTEEEHKTQKRKNSEEDKLYELPEHLKNLVPAKKRKEDMISNQMLSGIPEVDLGIEAKIKNIEQTEEAKQQLIIEKQRKNNKGASAFVPTNYAVNFVQHNRFNIEDHTPKYKKPIAAPEPTPLRVGDVDRFKTDELVLTTPTPGPSRPNDKDKATDDYHFEKFRRQNRKY